jgi:uncharacterized repeat protein (TIGR03803 family)
MQRRTASALGSTPLILVTLGILACVPLLAQSALAAKQFQITSCPYTANVANAIYTVVNEIGVRAGDCIDISAPGITIQVNGQTVYTEESGYAINVYPAAKRTHIMGPGTVWQTIFDEGDSALIEGLTIGGTAGGPAVVLEGARASVVKGNSAYGGWGSIWLDNTRSCVVDHNKAESGSGYIGIQVTNSDPKTTRSKNNVISGNDVRNNGLGIGLDGTGATCAEEVPTLGNIITGNVAGNTPGPSVGISLGCGAHHTVIMHNTALNDWNYDAFDDNAHCTTNTWKDNKFRNVYPSCIIGQPPKEKPLYDFGGGTDGYAPFAGLIFDKAGNMYGTTPQGGTGCGGQGCGTAFKLTPSHEGWAKTTIHEFTGTNGDGSAPSSGFILDQAGNLYGETSFGGLFNAGTVFELSPNSDGGWTETILYNFMGGIAGVDPNGGLIFDQAGNLYGAAGGGNGNPRQCNGGTDCGVVFKLTPGAMGMWTGQLLYSFKAYGSDGMDPHGGVTFDGQGNLYGTTYLGGANGQGTVYELKHAQNGTWTESLIHSFANDENGRAPLAGLILDNAGNVYGTTWRAGAADAGTVFELSPASGGTWIFKLLHTFSGLQDVGNPVAGLIFDPAGNLYGTGEGGGYEWPSVGIVFKLTPKTDGHWKETVLYHFGGGPDGGYPTDSLVFDAAGNLYGTALDGGNTGCNYGCGVVFEVMK